MPYELEEMKDLIEENEFLILCPINKTPMEDPVQAVDEMVYEHKAIKDWVLTNPTSPITGQQLNSNFTPIPSAKRWEEQYENLRQNHKEIKQAATNALHQEQENQRRLKESHKKQLSQANDNIKETLAETSKNLAKTKRKLVETENKCKRLFEIIKLLDDTLNQYGEEILIGKKTKLKKELATIQRKLFINEKEVSRKKKAIEKNEARSKTLDEKAEAFKTTIEQLKNDPEQKETKQEKKWCLNGVTKEVKIIIKETNDLKADINSLENINNQLKLKMGNLVKDKEKMKEMLSNFTQIAQNTEQDISTTENSESQRSVFNEQTPLYEISMDKYNRSRRLPKILANGGLSYDYLNETDDDNRNVLHYIAQNAELGEEEIIAALKEAGVELNWRDNEGKTPLDLASNHEIIRHMKSLGCLTGKSLSQETEAQEPSAANEGEQASNSRDKVKLKRHTPPPFDFDREAIKFLLKNHGKKDLRELLAPQIRNAYVNNIIKVTKDEAKLRKNYRAAKQSLRVTSRTYKRRHPQLQNRNVQGLIISLPLEEQRYLEKKLNSSEKLNRQIDNFCKQKNTCKKYLETLLRSWGNNPMLKTFIEETENAYSRYIKEKPKPRGKTSGKNTNEDATQSEIVNSTTSSNKNNSKKRFGLFESANNNPSKQRKMQQLLNASMSSSGCFAGSAVGEGDCFFDSVAQDLNEINVSQDESIESLRRLCNDYAKNLEAQHPVCIANASEEDKNSNWIFQACNKNVDLYQRYLMQSRFTAEEAALLKEQYKIGDGLAIWGEQTIDAIIICKHFKINIHVLELHSEFIDQSGFPPILHQLIDEKCIHSLGEVNHEIYHKTDTINIAVGNKHFCPILHKKNSLKKIKNKKKTGKQKKDGDQHKTKGQPTITDSGPSSTSEAPTAPPPPPQPPVGTSNSGDKSQGQQHITPGSLGKVTLKPTPTKQKKKKKFNPDPILTFPIPEPTDSNTDTDDDTNDESNSGWSLSEDESQKSDLETTSESKTDERQKLESESERNQVMNSTEKHRNEIAQKLKKRKQNMDGKAKAKPKQNSNDSTTNTSNNTEEQADIHSGNIQAPETFIRDNVSVTSFAPPSNLPPPAPSDGGPIIANTSVPQISSPVVSTN